MLQQDFFKLLERVGNVILLTVGILLIPKEVKDLTDSEFLSSLTLIVLILILVAIIIYYALPYPTQRRFGIHKYKSSPILTFDKETVYIDEKFQTLIKTEKDIIYSELPSEYDRVDLIEIAANETFDSIHYESVDSIVAKKIRKKKNRVAFMWEPKDKIIPYVIYRHQTEYVSPSNYGDNAFYHVHHVDLNTGIIDYTFHCFYPVELAVAFKLPYFQTTPKYRLLDKFAFEQNQHDCRQPNILSDKKKISWKLVAPEKNRSYAIFVVYNGQKDKFRNSIDRRNWLRRKLFPDKNKIT